MHKRSKILLVVSPERKDFYSYLQTINDADFFILWYVRKKDSVNADPPSFIKGQFYWGEYFSPFTLIKKIQPDKIIFFEIIDLRQIALIVSARAKKIKTFYLEHGAAGSKETAILRWDDETFLDHKLRYLKKRFFTSLGDIIKSKLFYYSVTRRFDSFRSYLKYFFLPLKMLTNTPNKILSHTKFKERVPDVSIVFNRANFEEYALYTGINETEAELTGVPLFDNYYRKDMVEEEHIVYIEHPYLEEKILGWNAEHHRQIAEALFEFAEKNKKKIYIKLHPRSVKERWARYEFNPEFVEIIQHGEFTDLFLRAKIILGFSSSLLIGLLSAQKNIVLLGWHPEPKIFGADFSKTGLCHISFLAGDLNSNFNYWQAHNLAKENIEQYNLFLKQYNFPFDGKATERVIGRIIID